MYGLCIEALFGFLIESIESIERCWIELRYPLFSIEAKGPNLKHITPIDSW